MQTLQLDGTPVEAPITEHAYEYRLFETAATRFPHSPGAGYEVLRFGRVLGPDALNPPDAPHWRRVSFPGGVGWVNLNAANVRKFSDADFPFWDNWWMLVDGSASPDSRCRDVKVLELLDTNNDLNVTPQEAEQKLRDPDVQRRLSHKICKFHTEWDAACVDQHWRWLQTDPQTRMTAADFARFKAHVSALCFWQQAQLPINPVHWHFHPRQFIGHFRQCGWLSLNELTQLMPRRPANSPPVSWSTAQARFRPYLSVLNQTLRKYNILDARRQTHFLAQTYIECGLWTTMREIGRGRQQRRPDGTLFWPAAMMEFYTAFYGHGIMQLTWPANFDLYGTFRQFPHLNPHADYQDNRITHTSTHHWSGPGNPVLQWYPRYDPEIVADDNYAACDSGGLYWVSKDIGHHQMNINTVADQGVTRSSVGRASVLVNGGSFGFAERQSYAAFIKKYRDDYVAHRSDVENMNFDEQQQTANFDVQRGHSIVPVSVDFTPQRP